MGEGWQVVNEGSSTLRYRRLGNELRTLRERAGITVDAGRDQLGFSPNKITRIETGISGVSAKDLHAMLTLGGLINEYQPAA